MEQTEQPNSSKGILGAIRRTTVWWSLLKFFVATIFQAIIFGVSREYLSFAIIISTAYGIEFTCQIFWYFYYEEFDPQQQVSNNLGLFQFMTVLSVPAYVVITMVGITVMLCAYLSLLTTHSTSATGYGLQGLLVRLLFLWEVLTPNALYAFHIWKSTKSSMKTFAAMCLRLDILVIHSLTNILLLVSCCVVVPFQLRKYNCFNMKELGKTKYPLKLVWSFLKLVIAIVVSGLLLTIYRPMEKTYTIETKQYSYAQAPLDNSWQMYLGIMLVYLLAFSLELFYYFYYYHFGSFDPEIEVIEVALSYSMDVDKITTLLHPGACLLSCLTFSVIFMSGYAHSYLWHDSAGGGYNTTVPSGQPLVTFFMLEIFAPAASLAIAQYKRSGGSVLQAIICLVSFDLLLVLLLIKGLQVVLLPLSVLSYISIWKASHGMLSADATQKNAKLLSHVLRDNWSSTKLTEDAKYLASLSCAARTWEYTKRLSARFTVVYSFIKLVGTLALAFCFGSYGYMYCNAPSHLAYYRQQADFACAATECRTYCVSRNDHYPPYSYINNGQCEAELPGDCLCSNWLLFQIPLIVLNTIHFVVQCYFFIRYNSFDPQQNQIDCVQSYAFAGENLALFLTQPSICFLSALESLILVFVWTQYATRPGVSCVNNLYSYALADAAYMTVMEVYKANMSVATSQFMDDVEYKPITRSAVLWALWSLVRIDLFVFYGLTLFLQTFVFPFAFVSYVTAVLRQTAAEVTSTITGKKMKKAKRRISSKKLTKLTTEAVVLSGDTSSVANDNNKHVSIRSIQAEQARSSRRTRTTTIGDFTSDMNINNNSNNLVHHEVNIIKNIHDSYRRSLCNMSIPNNNNDNNCQEYEDNEDEVDDDSSEYDEEEGAERDSNDTPVISNVRVQSTTVNVLIEMHGLKNDK